MARTRRLKTPLSILRRIPFLILILLILAGLYLYSHYRKDKPPNKVIVTAGTAVTPPAAINNSTPAAKAPSESAGSRNIGTATDTKGSATTNTSSNQWVTSASGDITVKQPLANSKIGDGSTLSGSAKVGQIHYRLSDNKVGVVSQGILNVVNGNFSGTIHFSPQGTGGRLDVFSTDSVGVEYNEIQVNVSY